MKRILTGGIVIVAAGLLMGGAAGTAGAQDAPATAAADAAAQPEVKADWTTFAKAIGAVYGSVTFAYDADTDLAVTAKGVAVKGKQKTKFLGQRPDKARVEVTLGLGDDLKDGRKYVSVVDGTTYWVNRLDKPRYSATPADKVDLTKDFTALGVLGSLYFNRDLMGGLSSLTDDRAEALLPTYKGYGIDLSKGVEALDGKSVPVYNLNLMAMKINIKFFVDAVSANISRVEVSVKDIEKGMDFKLTERVTKIERQPTVKEDLFAFTPTAGLDKAETRLPVDFFHE